MATTWLAYSPGLMLVAALQAHAREFGPPRVPARGGPLWPVLIRPLARGSPRGLAGNEGKCDRGGRYCSHAFLRERSLKKTWEQWGQRGSPTRPGLGARGRPPGSPASLVRPGFPPEEAPSGRSWSAPSRRSRNGQDSSPEVPPELQGAWDFDSCSPECSSASSRCPAVSSRRRTGPFVAARICWRRCVAWSWERRAQVPQRECGQPSLSTRAPPRAPPAWRRIGALFE